MSSNPSSSSISRILVGRLPLPADHSGFGRAGSDCTTCLSLEANADSAANFNRTPDCCCWKVGKLVRPGPARNRTEGGIVDDIRPVELIHDALLEGCSCISADGLLLL